MTTSIKGGIPVGGNLAFRDLVYRPGIDGPAEMMPMPYYGGGMGIEQLAADPSFQINRGPGALGGRSEEQIRRLQQNMPQNQQLLDEMKRRGITPGGGPSLPLASSMGGIGNVAGLANSSFFRGPQIAQLPDEFAGKSVY